VSNSMCISPPSKPSQISSSAYPSSPTYRLRATANNIPSSSKTSR
jgi:hypothetical protein